LRKHYKTILAIGLLTFIVCSLLWLDILQSGQREAKPVNNPVWHARHDYFKYAAKNTPINLLFIGDSITQGWETAGAAPWQKNYAPVSAANFGIAGDAWENVLWRMTHGELKGIHARLIVLLIGTNNVSHGEEVSDIANGISQVVAAIRERCPNTKILLLGIFPRDHQPNTEYRRKIVDINTRISRLTDGSKVFYLDIGNAFLDAEGHVPFDVMPDELHLSPKGYQIWADAQNPTLVKLYQSQ
jgi:lysophospholipase L1-like esterase